MAGQGFARLRIDPVIAIAAPVGDPAIVAAIGHRHRHAEAARCDEMAEGLTRGDVADGGDEIGRRLTRKAAQQPRAVIQVFLRVGVVKRSWFIARREKSLPRCGAGR